MDDIKPEALIDLAYEATCHFRPFEVDFPLTTSNRLKRKYHIRIAPERILELANHFREVYRYGSDVLPEHTRPVHGKYSSPEDIDRTGMLTLMTEKYPEDDPELLSWICNRVILYDYLF